MSRWWSLIRERFPLGSTLPMAVAFVLANAAIAAGTQGVSVEPVRVVAAGALALSFLFRLRLFDELKDYQVDLVVNPERPLARGLLERGEVRRVAAVLVVAELLLAAGLGPWSFAMHALAVGYSGLMYREFFVGRWLRPHLTAYALVHTLVSALLGWSIAVAVAPREPWTLAVPVLAFGLVNWMVFNVFEFARKTFAPSEERDQVESYSKVFGPAGAGWLTVSQIVVAVGVLGTLGPDVVGRGLVSWQAAIAGPPVGAAIVYGVCRGVGAARVLRAVSGVWVILFFAVVAAAMLGKGG